MTNKAGVWIDHKQAVLVLLTDGGREIKKSNPALKSRLGLPMVQNRRLRTRRTTSLRKIGDSTRSRTIAKNTSTRSSLICVEPKQF